MKVKRLVYYLLLNIAVSASTMLIVLFIWQRQNTGDPLTLFSGAVGGRTATTIVMDEFVLQDETPVVVTQSPLRSYRIQDDETIEDIAVVTGLTVDEILDLNGITSVDALEPGSVILLPVEAGEAPSIGTQDPDGDRADQPAPAAVSNPAAGQGLVKVHIVVAPGDLNEEYIEIQGSGEDPISLRDWTLQDEDGNVFVFPEMTMYGSGSIRIYTRVGNSNPLKLYWGQSAAMWDPGETVTLIDSDGEIVSVYSIP